MADRAEISLQDQRRFERATRSLDRVISEITKKYSGSFAYLDGTGNLNLMQAPEGTLDAIKQEYVVTTGKLRASGGDW